MSFENFNKVEQEYEGNPSRFAVGKNHIVYGILTVKKPVDLPR